MIFKFKNISFYSHSFLKPRNKEQRMFFLNFKKIFKLLFLLLTLYFFLPAFSFSQNKNKLEKTKKNNQKEIDYTNKLLKANKQHKNKSLNALLILSRKISLRKELMQNINSEVLVLNKKIDQSNKDINSCTKELRVLKEDYAQLIYYAYKNRNSYEKLMFILSAKDFNQAYKRLKYMQQYSEYRRKQAKGIVKNQKYLQRKLAELEKRMNQKQELLLAQEEEAVLLEREKGEQTEILTSLKSKEKELKKKLEEQVRLSQKLQKEIHKIIAAEEEARRQERVLALKAKKAKEKKSKAEKIKNAKNNLHADNKAEKQDDFESKDEEKETTDKVKKSVVFDMTPEEKITSTSFGNNRGKLPWPTEHGLITGTFGEHEHPILKGIMIRNDGIDISTAEGENVRAIFSGVVSKVMKIPGHNNVIIIRHGNFLSVYSNLSQAYVKSGDKVSSKQSIGKVFTDADEDNKTTLHFEIWKDNNKLNPSSWLTPKVSN